MKLGLSLGLTAMHHRTPVSANPLPGLANLLAYVDFTKQSAYTFASGTTVQSVAPQAGTAGFEQTTAGKQPLYNSAAFSGKGGVVMQDANDYLIANANSGAPAVTTLGFVLSLPSYASGNNDLFALGSTSSGSASARLTHAAAGRLSYGRNEASQFVVIGDRGADGVHLVILRYNGASSLDAYVDTSSTPVNLDPLVNYQAQRAYLGDRNASTGDPGLAFAEFFQTGSALGNGTIAEIMSYWAARYGVTLS